MQLLREVDGNSDKTPLLASKLRPPRLRKVLARSRLLSRAELGAGLKLVNICAGPGFGKTTLMAQIAQSFEGHSVWYQVDNLDCDTSVFIRHLVSGVTHACDLNAVRTNSRINETSDFIREGENILAILLDELGQHTQKPLLICFDDFHLFDKASQAPRLVDYLVQNLPENLSMIIASRAAPTLALGRLRAQGAVCDFGEKDLKFSLDELSGLLAQWKIDSSASVLHLAHKSTEGWAAGLVLTESYLRSGNEAPHLFKKRHMQQAVYEYLAEEVLNKQNAETRELLLHMALIDPVDPTVCRTALDTESAESVLAKAEQNNLFTTRLDDANLYRFHPLFREFLLSQLTLEIGIKAVNRRREIFAEAFRSVGKDHYAIEQYLESGNYKKAIALIEIQAEEMVKKAEYETLGRWLDSLNLKELPVNIKIYQAIILMSMGKFHKASKILREVQSCLTVKDIQRLCKARIAYSECLCELGKSDQAIDILNALLEFSMPPELRLEVLHQLGNCYWVTFNDEGLNACCEMASQIECDQDTPLAGGLKFALSMKSLRQGNFSKAYHLLTEYTDDEELTESQKNIRMNNIASCLMMMGRYSDARALVEKCKERIEGQGEIKLLPTVLDTLGCLLIAEGVIDRGKNMLNLALEKLQDIERNRSDLSAGILCHLGTLARRSGDYEKAFEFHSKSVSISNSLSELYEVAMGTANMAADMIRQLRFAEAEKYFEKAENAAKKHNLQYVQTFVDFSRAWSSHLLNEKEGECKYITSALKRAKKFHHNHFMIQEGRVSLPLFSTALENGIEVDYVFKVLVKIGEDTLPLIEKFICHNDPLMRKKAAFSIDKIGSSGALALLRRMRYDSDEQIQRFVNKSLIRLRGNLNSHLEILTPRESEVLKSLAEGLSNVQLAERLFISERTVKTHIANIFRKLGFTKRLDAALYYRQLEEKSTTLQD
ncbi:MAG: LuxR C-terminal-related transcriptional regulator [Thermoleophilia bacterium]